MLEVVIVIVALCYRLAPLTLDLFVISLHYRDSIKINRAKLFREKFYLYAIFFPNCLSI